MYDDIGDKPWGGSSPNTPTIPEIIAGLDELDSLNRQAARSWITENTPAIKAALLAHHEQRWRPIETLLTDAVEPFEVRARFSTPGKSYKYSARPGTPATMTHWRPTPPTESEG